MNLSTRTVLTLLAEATKVAGLSPSHDPRHCPVNVTLAAEWRTGTDLSQANALYDADADIPDGQTDTIDLLGGALKDGFGDAVAMTAVKLLFIENDGTAALEVAGTNGIVGAGFTLGPGEAVIKRVGLTSAGYTTGAGASDTITIQNSAGAAGSYRLAVIGVQ